MEYKMISLYDRLKPHYSEQFEKVNLKHPKMTGMLIDILQKESFVVELKYKTVIDLKFLFGINTPFEMFKDL
tara:strand:+ start:1068 stop:1283 length:216 start_codon:yes stop_codon:yes gene_type:complete